MRPAGWIALVVLAAAIVYMTAPNFRRARMRRWRGARFAHRGLHDVEAGIVENTLPAFEAACAAGCGIELDIRFTRDLQVVVFHDDTLARLTGDPRRVSACALQELRAFRLRGIQDAVIPTLDEALSLVDGRVPLLIELKSGRHNARLCAALMKKLSNYRGECLVESFNPLIVRWFRRHAPRVPRGQLVCPMRDYRPAADGIGCFFMAGLMLNFLSRPDFVAYDVNARRFFSPHFQRFAFRTPMAAWTVRSERIEALVQARGEMSIFEKMRI